MRGRAPDARWHKEVEGWQHDASRPVPDHSMIDNVGLTILLQCVIFMKTFACKSNRKNTVDDSIQYLNITSPIIFPSYLLIIYPIQPQATSSEACTFLQTDIRTWYGTPVLEITTVHLQRATLANYSSWNASGLISPNRQLQWYVSLWSRRSL